MNEEHTNHPLQQPEFSEIPESTAEHLSSEADVPMTGDRPEYNPEYDPEYDPEYSDVSVALNLEAITHDSLNWQEIEDSVRECIPPEVLETLQTEMEQVRQNNSALLDRISQLETALVHSQQALQTYQERQPATEALLSQRLEEINTLQEDNQRLISEREQSNQLAQRKQILVETLTEQLETSQTQVAQLERDCTIVQQRSHEQATQLNQRDKFCIDLQTRLHRQQRYTLQFKNALDRCLELSKSNGEPLVNAPPYPDMDTVKLTKLEHGLTPKVVAIQPWSTIARSEDSALVGSKSPSPLYKNPEDNLQDSKTTPVPKLELLTEPMSPEVLDNSAPETVARAIALQKTSDEENEDFDPEPPSFSAEFDDLEGDRLEEVSSQEDIEPLEESKAIAEPESQPDRDYLETFSVANDPQLQMNLPQPNWPSPLVYPLRTPKKRKSLAAIELPSFPRS